MKVGDLISYIVPSDNKSYIALVVAKDKSGCPWIRWLDDNQLEPLDNYDGCLQYFEVISESR